MVSEERGTIAGQELACFRTGTAATDVEKGRFESLSEFLMKRGKLASGSSYRNVSRNMESASSAAGSTALTETSADSTMSSSAASVLKTAISYATDIMECDEEVQEEDIWSDDEDGENYDDFDADLMSFRPARFQKEDSPVADQRPSSLTARTSRIRGSKHSVNKDDDLDVVRHEPTSTHSSRSSKGVTSMVWIRYSTSQHTAMRP